MASKCNKDCAKDEEKVHSVQDLVDILRSDAGKAFICIVKENVIHLWKQIHPRRMRGKVIFGTGDPCSTGELLGVLALFMHGMGMEYRLFRILSRNA